MTNKTLRDLIREEIKNTLKEEASTKEVNGIYYINGKSFDEWRKIFKDLPYDDLIELAELRQFHKMSDMFRAMKKYMKNG